MGADELLRAACELSYVVARGAADAESPVEAPAAMQSYLNADPLPAKALTVAQQAIEEDPSFRRRVAEQATESEVGRAGFLWLHRPIGWAAEFEELTMHSGDDAGDGLVAADPFPAPGAVEALPAVTGEVPVVDLRDDQLIVDDDDAPAFELADTDHLLGDEEPEEVVVGSPTGSFGAIDVFGNGGGGLDLPTAPSSRGRSEANAIEDELLSLRGLVDRLSNERKAVSSSVRQAEQDLARARYQPSVFDTDVYSLQSELEAARGELEDARRERDHAIREHSDSLTRQLELERELERQRELRAEIEREHAEADTAIVDVKETLARAEASLATLRGDHEEVSRNLATARTENEDLKLQVARLTDTAAAQTRQLETHNKSLLAEIDTHRSDKESLAARLSALETEHETVRTQLSQTGNQAAEARSLVDALTEEKIDLASRLADTEAMLETTRTQLAAVKADAEAIAAELGNVRGHRDGLSSQVEELHGSLREALSDLAKVRSASDNDRAALKEVRAERDLLRVRVSSLEQIEKGLEAKLANLAVERDAFAQRTDQIRAELADRERHIATVEAERDSHAENLQSANQSALTLTSERDNLLGEIDGHKSTVAELELARDGLAVQVQQLSEENERLQAQMVENERLQQEASDNQGRALSELAHRLALAENERNRLEGELRNTEEQLQQALGAVEKAMETAEKARQNQLAAEQAARTATPLAAPVAPAEPVAPSLPGLASPAPSALGLPAEPMAPPPPSGPLPVADAVPAGPPAEPVAEVGTWPPPPAQPDEPAPAPPVAGGPALLPPPAQAPDPKVAEPRPPKRIWGFGPRLRSDQAEADSAQQNVELEAPAVGGTGRMDEAADALPPPPAAAPAADLLPPPPAALGPLDAPAAPQERVPATGPEPDYDLDMISSELSQAAGQAGLLPSPDEEDLDEISKLIKQTVTDFDPASLQAALNEGGVDTGEESRRWGRRLFPGRDSGPLPAADKDPDQTMVVKGGPLADPASTFERDPADDGSLRPKAGRRQIDIPAGLDDEVEVARQVVSSPDVVLLVDGDSVAKMGWPSLPVAQQRDALVSYLADLSTTTGASPDVVFDGRIGEEDSLPASRSVRIRLSTPPTEPAAALDELVDAYPEQWPIAVVTDDPELTRSAQQRGATVLNNGQLLDLFIVQ